MLDFQRLDAYQCALQFAGLTVKIVEALPRGHGVLAEQFRRASLSIPLNIAEGSGKPSEADRRRFHAIARGSAMECGALIDVMRVQSLLDDEVAAQAQTLVTRLVSMLSVMSRKS